ncbi:F0F1 ATP synthase subunit B [Candidatus Pelagibacter sp.]|nr:F0F1 ATP synthase subunit B [Candidatus Pelagibacter sp.]
MIKKIFFQSIFLSFLSFMEAFAAESGGMPQLNPEFWVSQIFWLTITFGILYVVLSKLILPKISANLEIRKSQILENIEAAENQRKESELKIAEYEKIVQNSKDEAKSYFKHAREKLLKDIKLKKNSLDNDLNREIQKAESEIEELRIRAPEKINKIAVETSSDLLQQLIGTEVNSSSISAIVDDLSRKKMVKYYGN